VDLAAEQRLAAVLAAAAAGGLLSAAHDVSEGGLGLALAESCLTGAGRAARPGRGPGIGCVVTMPAGPAGTSGSPDPLAFLFSESAARAVVVVRPGAEVEFAALGAANGVPANTLGVTGGDVLEVSGLFTVPVAELSAVSQRTLPDLFGPR